MSKIVKTCINHGDLTEEQVKYEKNGDGYESIRCHLCKIEKDRKWRENNRENHRASASKKRNESRKLFREGLTDVEPKANIWARKDRQDNKEKYAIWAKTGRDKIGILRSIREVTRLRGITVEEYYSLVGEQDNLCAICGLNETRLSSKSDDICRLAIDHCHKINKVRGLLCHNCNTGLGKFKDDPLLLAKAVQYLSKHHGIELLETAIAHLTQVQDSLFS